MKDARHKFYDLLDRVRPLLAAYIERKTYEQYRSRLWRAALRLFNGGADGNFMASFARSVDQQLTEAWNKGAAEVGVMPDEMTNDDVNILRSIIVNELHFIERIAIEIQADAAMGLTREQFESRYGSRISLWANRYTETLNRARMVFGQKQRFEWVEGGTLDKCPFCLALNGIVAFGYEWEQARAHPQMPPNRALTGEMNGRKGCKGWGCECEFKKTTKRRTARAFDRITEIVLRV